MTGPKNMWWTSVWRFHLRRKDIALLVTPATAFLCIVYVTITVAMQRPVPNGFGQITLALMFLSFVHAVLVIGISQLYVRPKFIRRREVQDENEFIDSLRQIVSTNSPKDTHIALLCRNSLAEIYRVDVGKIHSDDCYRKLASISPWIHPMASLYIRIIIRDHLGLNHEFMMENDFTELCQGAKCSDVSDLIHLTQEFISRKSS